MITDKLKGVNRVRVFEQGVEQIRSLIEHGDIAQGEKLPTEQELCEALKMSRSSIREALRVLEAEGLIETHRGAGTYVPANIPNTFIKKVVMNWLKQRGDSLIQILQVRECIEGLTIALAASRHPPELINELSVIIGQLERISKQEKEEIDLDEFANLNTQFHLAISSYSGNDIANEILLHILPAFSEGNKAVLFTHRNLKIQLIEHHEILDAIKVGDSQKAERIMRSHIIRVRKEVQKIREEAS